MLALLCACGDDGAALADANPKPSDGPADAGKNVGLVAIVEDNASNNTIALAAWGTDLDIIVSSRDDGPCHIERANAGNMARASAGTVSIAGGSAATVTMPFDAVNGYVSVASGSSYAPDDQLTISATGGVVPAFSGQLAFPALLTVTSGTPTAIYKTMGFTATWDATTSPVTVTINQYPSNAAKLGITCRFDGTAGIGAVPASAVTDLLFNVPASIAILTETNVKIMAGDYPTDLRASYAAILKSGIVVKP